MTPRSFRRWIVAGFFGACVSLFAQPTPSPAPAVPVTAPTIAPKDDEMVQKVDLRDAPIDLVLGLLESWTGRTILRPQQLPTPTFTINLGKPLPKSEAVLALETLLNLNGIGVIPVGDRYLKIVDLPRVRMEAPQLIEGSTLDLPPSGQVATKLFQLEFQRVTEFLPQINMLLNGNIGGYVVFEKSNAALITDSISTLQRIELLIKKLDQPLTTGLTPRFYSIRFAKASDLVSKINSIVQGPLQNQLGAATKYSADDRTNQIVLLADPRQYPFFDDLIDKLDVKADPNTRNEVIYLKHAAAKDVATLLSNLISNQTKATQSGTSTSVRSAQFAPNMPNATPPGVQPAPILPGTVGDLNVPTNEFSGLVSVQPDERSNAVVVSGTVDDIRLIQELVEKIDVLLAQVRIEVVIAEVSLSDSDSTGISALGLKLDGNKLVGFSLGAGNAGVSVSGASDTGTASGLATIAHPGWDLSGLVSLSTTPRKNNSHILSNPIITTTHNKEATVFVGETRPVISSYLPDTSGSTAVGTGYRTSINQQEIGIRLKVKPLIGSDNSVQLEIDQEVNDVGPNVTIDGNPQPIVLKRTTSSFISVKSGEIIVLGGLQRKKKTRETNRLGPIPFIGDLLGARSHSNDRQELIFFLRPTVLTNSQADNSGAFSRLETMPNKGDVNEALGIAPPAKEEKHEDRPELMRPRKH